MVIGPALQYYKDTDGDLSNVNNVTLKKWVESIEKYCENHSNFKTLEPDTDNILTQMKNKLEEKGIITSVINVDDYKPSSTTSNESINNIVNVILGAVRAIGSIIAVGSLMLMGIKYMVGSVEEKAEYKKTMIPYLIGIVLLFAGVNIVAMIYNVVQNSIN